MNLEKDKKPLAMFMETTPMRPEVFLAMEPYLKEWFGLPSSINQQGLHAREAIETAREHVASLIGAQEGEEIIFTSSGTEAFNTIIKGAAHAYARKGKKIVVSALEHPAVMASADWLAKTIGITVEKVPVDSEGFLDQGAFKEALTPDTILACVQHGNPDIGTIQNFPAIGQIAANREVPLLVDATASAGWIPVNLRELRASYLVLSPHRFYGPKGVGILCKARGFRLQPLIHGGLQENGRRGGSENIPAMVGAGTACLLAISELRERSSLASQLQTILWERIHKRISQAYLNGPQPGLKRLPQTLNVSFSGNEGEGLALALDMQGISVSTGSTCGTKTKIPAALAALGLPVELARASLILSARPKEISTTDLESIVLMLNQIVGKLRAMAI